MDFSITPAYDYADEIAALFKEYTDMLIECEPKFIDYLVKQNYSEEVSHLETKYGLPDGRIYIVHNGKSPVGCIALRKIDSENCELKRLYVRPQYRGNKIAETLVDRILSDAKEIGYSHILLDTFPFLTNALRLYKKLGFYEIESYNNSPMGNLIYLKYDL